MIATASPLNSSNPSLTARPKPFSPLFFMYLTNEYSYLILSTTFGVLSVLPSSIIMISCSISFDVSSANILLTHSSKFSASFLAGIITESLFRFLIT
jgi:hypothetical protein